jgi:hypothetical protein
LESKAGGGLSIIEGILLFLSIPYVLFVAAGFASTAVGYTVTFGEILGVLQDKFPALYTTIIAGIIVNILFGCLLLVFGGMFIVGKGTSTIAKLAILIGILSIVFSIASTGGIVVLIGGFLGIVGGSLSRKKGEL